MSTGLISQNVVQESRAETILSLSAQLLEDVDSRRTETRLINDVLLEIFSYLDPADAARAGRVCMQWNRHSARATYTHVFLHSASSSSALLASTMSTYSHLRAYVRRVTVVHCKELAMDVSRSLYGWMEGLDPGSLESFRYIGYARGFEMILFVYKAVQTARHLQCLTLHGNLPSSWRLETPRDTCSTWHDSFIHFSNSTFLADSLPLAGFDLNLSALNRSTVRLITGGETCMDHMRTLLPLLQDFIFHARAIYVTLRYTSCSTPSFNDILRLNERLPQRTLGCLCLAPPVAILSSQCPAVSATVVGGQFPVETVGALLDWLPRPPSQHRPIQAIMCFKRAPGVVHPQHCAICKVVSFSVLEESV